jgi:hypothetical protein
MPDFSVTMTRAFMGFSMAFACDMVRFGAMASRAASGALACRLRCKKTAAWISS